MADNKDDRGPADRSRINIHEDYEVQYWTDKFGVTPEELIEAVGKVGPMAEDVRKELGR